MAEIMGGADSKSEDERKAAEIQSQLDKLLGKKAELDKKLSKTSANKGNKIINSAATEMYEFSSSLAQGEDKY